MYRITISSQTPGVIAWSVDTRQLPGDDATQMVQGDPVAPQVLLAVLILSSQDGGVRRAAMRETWLSVLPPSVVYRFMIGAAGANITALNNLKVFYNQSHTTLNFQPVNFVAGRARNISRSRHLARRCRHVCYPHLRGTLSPFSLE